MSKCEIEVFDVVVAEEIQLYSGIVKASTKLNKMFSIGAFLGSYIGC